MLEVGGGTRARRRSGEAREAASWDAKVELDVRTSTPAEFAKFVREETERWARVIKEANIRTE